MQVADLV
ncbi:Protein of unknown function [Bacillus wiedmannii]|nr:Protein of unknown function [Bacillus wiedmannii]